MPSWRLEQSPRPCGWRRVTSLGQRRVSTRRNRQTRGSDSGCSQQGVVDGGPGHRCGTLSSGECEERMRFACEWIDFEGTCFAGCSLIIGSRGTWWSAEGLFLFFWPFARRRPGRREMSEGVSVKRGRRAGCPLTNPRGLQASGEPSTPVPQSGRPLPTTVPYGSDSGGKRVRPPLSPAGRRTLGLSYRNPSGEDAI